MNGLGLKGFSQKISSFSISFAVHLAYLPLTKIIVAVFIIAHYFNFSAHFLIGA
jgi:hypothetical protein